MQKLPRDSVWTFARVAKPSPESGHEIAGYAKPSPESQAYKTDFGMALFVSWLMILDQEYRFPS